MELSSLIGKEILTPAGDGLGYVKSAFVSRDFKRLSCLVCIDEDEEEFYLPARAVLAADAVIIAGKGRLPAPTGIPCPVGVAAYSEKGEIMGLVGDLIVGEGDPVYVIVKDGNRTPFPSDCIAKGKKIIVYPQGKPKRAARGKQTKKPEPPAAQIAAEVSATAAEECVAATPAGETQTGTFDALNRCNLLGRRIKKSVYDENGAPIALENERVTPEILSCARRHNKLLLLTVNTLTNIY